MNYRRFDQFISLTIAIAFGALLALHLIIQITTQLPQAPDSRPIIVTPSQDHSVYDGR